METSLSNKTKEQVNDWYDDWDRQIEAERKREESALQEELRNQQKQNS